METWRELTPSERDAIADLALRGVAHAAHHRAPLPVTVTDFPPALQAKAATFITLRMKDGSLRGCVGVTTAFRALAEDIAANAMAAACRDPRFNMVEPSELPEIDVSISVLTPSERLYVDSHGALIDALRSGIDGLTLEDGSRRACFLPSMWSQLPQAQDFVRQLKLKAGWRPDHWSETMKVWRYTAVKIP